MGYLGILKFVYKMDTTNNVQCINETKGKVNYKFTIQMYLELLVIKFYHFWI
jgi:hypothetical protein